MATIHYVQIANEKWHWGEDYVRTSSTYIVSCPHDRQCQVGMGIFAFGEPRGEKITFSGTEEIWTIGLGALHFRVDDNKGRCEVGFSLKDSTPIKFKWEF
jgi:hypothetical protein